MLNRSCVAVDITGSDVRVLSTKGRKVHKWTTAPLPEGAVRDGSIIEPQTVGLVVDSIFRKLNLDRGNVICTTTGLPFIYRVISMPKTKQGIPSEAIERTARREMSLGEGDMFLIWKAIETSRSPDETDYFVVGVPVNALNPLTEALEKAQIRPASVDVKPLALGRALSLKEAIVVSMERHYYDVLLVADGLAKVIHSVTPSSKDQGPAAIASEAVDSLNIAVKSFDRDYPQNTFHPETAVYVAGELSLNDEIKRLVQQSTGRPVVSLRPTLEMPADLSPEIYAACLGLASKGSAAKAGSPYHDIDLNFLSPSKRASSVQFRLSYVIYPAIIALLAFLVYKSYTMKADADERIADLKKDSVQVTQLMAASQKASADATAARQAGNERLQAAQTELNSLNAEAAKIMARKYNYGNAIDLVTASLPETADYVNMSVRADGIQVEGHVTNIFDVLNFTEALERTGSFSSARAEEITPLADAPGANFRVIVKTN